jgi:hypothetical protein
VRRLAHQWFALPVRALRARPHPSAVARDCGRALARHTHARTRAHAHAHTHTHTHTYTHTHTRLPHRARPQEAVKRSLLLSPATAYRGYQPLGANVTRHTDGFTPDAHEALDYYKCVPEERRVTVTE